MASVVFTSLIAKNVCKDIKNNWFSQLFLAYIVKKSYLCSRFMKRILSIVFLLICIVSVWADEPKKPAYQIADNTFFDPTKKEEKAEPYQFSVDYRIEAGYAQHQQRTHEMTYPDMYLHGARVGATFSFNLPLHFAMQTGLLYTILYGRNEQHWRSIDAPSVQEEYIRHRVVEHNLTIPVRVYYTIPIWKKLNFFLFGGPQLHIGLAENDYMQLHLSEGTTSWLSGQGIPTAPYDRMASEILRANIQIGVGGGLEWDRYRLQSGYDFGLNNLVRTKVVDNQYMTEWGWFVSFSYRF